MEESFCSAIYSLQNSRCQNNHPIQLFCKNPNCKHPAPICKNQLCTQNLHKECSFAHAHYLIQKLQAKKTNVGPQVEIIWETLDNIYTQAIQKLSKDRDSIKAWYDSFGLNAFEHRLVQCVDLSYMDDISGKLVSQITERLKLGDKLNWPNPQKAKRLWGNFKSEFYKTFDQMAQSCLDYQVSIDELCQKSKLQKQILKLQKLGKQGNWHQIVNCISLKKDLTALTNLNLCQNRIQVIEGLQCLKNLRRLRLSENNIKKIQNLGHLKNLQVLDLNNNKIQKIEHLNGLKQRLRQLYLCDNLIKKIQNLRKLKRLSLAYLRGNPCILSAYQGKLVQEQGQREALCKNGVVLNLTGYVFLS